MTTDKNIEAIAIEVHEARAQSQDSYEYTACTLIAQARAERDAALNHAGYEQWKAEFDSLRAERDESNELREEQGALLTRTLDQFDACKAERDALQTRMRLIENERNDSNGRVRILLGQTERQEWHIAALKNELNEKSAAGTESDAQAVRHERDALQRRLNEINSRQQTYYDAVAAHGLAQERADRYLVEREAIASRVLGLELELEPLRRLKSAFESLEGELADVHGMGSYAADELRAALESK